MFICILCNRSLGNKGISSHLRRQHNISNQEYYDTYIKSENEGICKICRKPTKFDCIITGYKQYCSSKCANLDPIIRNKIETTSMNRFGVKCNLNLEETKIKAQKNSQSKEAIEKRKATNLRLYGAENVFASEQIKLKIYNTNIKKYNVKYSWQAKVVKNKSKQTNLYKYNEIHYMKSKKCIEAFKKARLDALEKFKIENNCSRKSDLIDEYGSGWYQANIINLIKYRGVLFVKNEDIPKIIEYSQQINTYISKPEVDLLNSIKEYYHCEISTTNRIIIHPMELDIYLPDLNIAIEYNGTYWHSIERGISLDYHLRKSLRCRNKGIRLIHIYEFEDFKQQKQLLKDLILGKDNYPKNDFNKNNLIEIIPQPTIIYQNNYTIYGAGPLLSN